MYAIPAELDDVDLRWQIATGNALYRAGEMSLSDEVYLDQLEDEEVNRCLMPEAVANAWNA